MSDTHLQDEYTNTARAGIIPHVSRAHRSRLTTQLKDLMSPWTFDKKLDDLGHFWTSNDNVDDLTLRFHDELDQRSR